MKVSFRNKHSEYRCGSERCLLPLWSSLGLLNNEMSSVRLVGGQFQVQLHKEGDGELTLRVHMPNKRMRLESGEFRQEEGLQKW